MAKFRIALCAAAAVLLAAGSSQAANLIANGDFETGSLTPQWAPTGVVSDTTESAYTGCCGFSTSHPGNHIAAFGGGVGTGHETLSQGFADVVGTTYTVNYDWAFIGACCNTLDVSVGGVTRHFFGGGSSNIDASYMHDTFSFVGTGSDTLTFSVLDSRQDSTDTIVDNVDISAATPEPASWALMIGGFGLAGAALRRRRMAVAVARA